MNSLVPVKGRYAAYLLRLWQDTTSEGRVWRVSLEAVSGGERRAFASLEKLFAYLSAMTEEPTRREEDTDSK